jgi:hypothetical protein
MILDQSGGYLQNGSGPGDNRRSAKAGTRAA